MSIRKTASAAGGAEKMDAPQAAAAQDEQRTGFRHDIIPDDIEGAQVGRRNKNAMTVLQDGIHEADVVALLPVTCLIAVAEELPGGERRDSCQPAIHREILPVIQNSPVGYIRP